MCLKDCAYSFVTIEDLSFFIPAFFKKLTSFESIIQDMERQGFSHFQMSEFTQNHTFFLLLSETILSNEVDI